MKYPEMMENHHYRLLVKRLSERAVIAKNELLKEDPQKFKTLRFKEKLQTLVGYYTHLALFPDSDVIKHFNLLSVQNVYLRWLIPLEDLEGELNKINATGKIMIYKFLLLKLILLHLQCKIIYELSEWGDLMVDHKSRKLVTTSFQTFNNIYRRRNDSNGMFPNSIMSENDLKWNLQITGYEMESGNPAKTQKEILQFMNGNTNYYLRRMVDCFHEDESIGIREFGRIVYNFFCLIMKDDPKMFTEDKFVELAPKKTKTFGQYQHTMMSNRLIR